jgi:hypothetical protein
LAEEMRKRQTDIDELKSQLAKVKLAKPLSLEEMKLQAAAAAEDATMIARADAMAAIMKVVHICGPSCVVPGLCLVSNVWGA